MESFAIMSAGESACVPASARRSGAVRAASVRSRSRARASSPRAGLDGENGVSEWRVTGTDPLLGFGVRVSPQQRARSVGIRATRQSSRARIFRSPERTGRFGAAGVLLRQPSGREVGSTAQVTQIPTVVAAATDLSSSGQNRPVAPSTNARISRSHVKAAVRVGAEHGTARRDVDRLLCIHGVLLGLPPADVPGRKFQGPHRSGAVRAASFARAREHGPQGRAQALTTRTVCQREGSRRGLSWCPSLRSLKRGDRRI